LNPVEKEIPDSFITKVIRFSLLQRILIMLIVLIAILAGIICYGKLSNDIFPDLTMPVFNILIENKSMAQEEVELLITRPVETAMNGLPGITSIRSTTIPGLAAITVSFSSDTDYYLARQFIAEKFSQVISLLPEGTERPVIGSVTTRLSEIFQYTIQGPSKTPEDLTKLRELAEFELKYKIMTTPNISKVINMGGYFRQYQVLLDPYKLQSLNLSLSNVTDAVISSNQGASGSFISMGSTEMIINGQKNRIQSIDDLAFSVVDVRKDSIPILLKDLGEVIDSQAMRRGIVKRNSEETVACTVVKQFGADTITTINELKKNIKDINASLPEGYKIVPYYDQTNLIESALFNVQKAILEGAFFVILVLIVFLGEIRSSFIVALIIPISVTITFLLMYIAKLSINTMSLGGIAIGITLLVDASIIDVENAVRRLSDEKNKNLPVILVVYNSIKEMRKPTTAATLIIIAVFFPLFMLGGLEGKMFKPLAFAVCSSMAAAFILSLTLTPVLCSYLLKNRDKEKEIKLTVMLKKVYESLLQRVFNHKKPFIIAIVIIVISVLFSSVFLPTEFMPEVDEGALFLSVNMPPDISLEKAIKLSGMVDKILRDIPEVTDIVSTVGRAEESECPVGINTSEVQANLLPPDKRKRSREDIVEELRHKLSEIPGIAATIMQPFTMRIEESLSGTPATISVKIFGDDVSILIKKGKEIETLMREIPGIVDLRMEQITDIPQLKIDIKREEAARYGITSSALSEYIEIALGGKEVSQIWKGNKNCGIFIRLMDKYRANPEQLQDLLIDTPVGARIPLKQIANIYQADVPNTIKHEAFMRRISIDCNIKGGDVGGIIKAIKEKIAKEISLPESYYVVYGGEYANQEKAFKSLSMAVIFAAFLVFILIYITLGSARVTILIMISLPVALVGGIIIMFLTGTSLNVASAIGFIALMGIAVQNSLVLFTNIQEAYEEEGLIGRDAIIKASIDRVRPKLMTVLCAILGLIPLVVTKLQGTELQKPLAIVIIGGLFTSTIFVLFVLPVLYDMFLMYRLKK